MSGKANPPLRQIETETLPHRAAEPSVGAAFRRPRPLDEPAEHDAGAFAEPRFDGAHDPHARTWAQRLSHHTVGKSGGKELDIIRWRNEQRGGGGARRQVIECGGELSAVGTVESVFAFAIPRQSRQHPMMTRGDLAQRARLFAEAFERRQRLCEPTNQIGGGREFAIGQADARIGRMQIDRLLAPESFDLHAKSFERAGKSRRAGPRPRPAQNRALERDDSLLGMARTEPQQRMLEQAEQGHRRKAAERRVDRQPGKRSSRRVGQRIAAAILGVDFPARQRGVNAPRQRAVRRHQGGGLVLFHRFAQRHRDRERLVFRMRGLDHGDRSERHIRVRLERRIGRAAPPQIGCRRRP